jgi:hypothetical protein
MSGDRDFESEAKTDGWVPLAEWKGDPAKWIPAEDFVKRGENILPILNAKLRKERERTESLVATVEELKEGNKLFREFHEKTLTKAQAERAQAIADLEEQRAKAITEGDGQTFTQTDKKLQELRAEPKKEPPKESPEVTAWKAANTWYGTDVETSAIADGLSDVVARENPGLKGRAFLDKLTERVKSVVPHKFENPRRQEQITVDGQRKGSNGKGRAYEDLPADAKLACDRFVKTIPGFTKEAYLTQYDWSEK